MGMSYSVIDGLVYYSGDVYDAFGSGARVCPSVRTIT